MIGKESIAGVARLARLALNEDEKEKFAAQLAAVLNAFEKLQSVNTDGVEPMVTPTPMPQRLRTDQLMAWPNVESALGNAPEKTGNLFKVPPVV